MVNSDGIVNNDDVITMSNGLKLRVKQVSRLLIAKMLKEIPEPRIPRVFIDDKGREEENPLDPTYQRSLAEYTLAIAEAQINAVLSMGVDIIEIPSSLEPVEGDEWASLISTLLGTDVPESGSWRRVAWLKYYAVPTEADLGILLREAMRSIATREEDVTDAVKNFPS